MKKIWIKGLCLLAVSLILFGNIGPVFADSVPREKLTDKYPIQSVDISYEDGNTYSQYLKANEHTDSEEVIQIDLSTLESENSSVSFDLSKNCIDWSSGDCSWIEFGFEIETSGFHNIKIKYRAHEGFVEAPRRGILIDGERPFKELSNILFDKIWCDEGEPEINALGDQVRPKQVEKPDIQSKLVYDCLGRYNEPLKIYLSAGTHTIKLEYIREALDLYEIWLIPPEKIRPYSEIKAEYGANGYQDADSYIKIDAEKPSKKTDSSLRLESSGDPKADPKSDGYVVYNCIGGPGWNKGNQSLTYSFVSPKSGLYKIGIRTYQKYSNGLDVFRQIKIDEKVPFEEFLSYKFEYKNWQNTVLSSSEGQPYMIYLEEGPHTIELIVKTAEYAEILNGLESTLNTFSKVIQGVMKITGISPDPNFDYELDKKLPQLMENLKEISDGLDFQIQQLRQKSSQSGKTPAAVNSLNEIKYKIDKMIKNPFIIAKQLSTVLINSQLTLSNWVKEFNNLPLMMDYIEFASENKQLERGTSGFFAILSVTFKNFIASYFKDYDTISGSTAEDSQKPLNIWISRGKEWGEILKQICDEEFTKETGISLNMNILPSGQLGTGGVMLLSVASGNAPDIVLGTDSATPAEYGMRGVLADLSLMEGYLEVSERFPEGTRIPYTFEDKVYAIPETIDFNILYYRKDILEELNIPVPDTWQELYQKILPVLKRNGMDFFYGGSVATFLFQNGGSYYSSDGKKSALNSQMAFDAFRQYTELYTIYGVPYEASFYTRFRAGQIPLGISPFSTYLMLTSAAPELEGKWGAAMLPGTVDTNGNANRSDTISSSSVMIFDGENHDNAWKFAEWYTRESTQLRYAGDLTAHIGPEAKWFSANTAAFDKMSWEGGIKKVLEAQREWGQGIPGVVGGYITARHLENARVRTILEGMNYRTSIEKAAMDITREMDMKNQEFAARKEKQ